MKMKQWFENPEQYVISDALGERPWPMTISLVRVNSDGTTQKGWGANDFINNYWDGRFEAKKALDRFISYGKPFGIVMRSVPLLCVDIDGKNGGIQSSRILNLTQTLAETSKSGNGYHLFYRIPEAVWDSEKGYDEFPDVNGLIPGVDIRATGIVYHHSNQRWNERDIAPMPDVIRRLLMQKKMSRALEQKKRETKLDGEDLAMAQHDILEELQKSIPKGRRNQTLYAIGAKMAGLNVPDWERALKKRALTMLPEAEVETLIRHINRYV